MADRLKTTELKPVHGMLLGLLIGGIVIAALHFLVKTPMLANKAKIDAQISKLRKDLETNRALIAGDEKFRQEHLRLAERLGELSARELVPEDNPVRWGSNLVERLAEAQGVTVNQFASSGTGKIDTQIETKKGTQTVPSPFQEFQVDLDLSGNYHQIGRFMAAVEKALPAARLQYLNIRARGRNPKEGLRVGVKYGLLEFSGTGFPPKNRPVRNDVDDRD